MALRHPGRDFWRFPAARRETLRGQREVLLARLAEHLPEWRYHVPKGGLSLWVTLPVPVSAALAATSKRFGVRILTGALFGTGVLAT